MVDPQTKRETDDERVIAVKEPIALGGFPTARLRWLPDVLKGASGLGERILFA